MPIRRKIYKRPDGSRLVTLPKTWVEDAEEKEGKEMEAVLMEVDKAIVLTPKFKAQTLEVKLDE